MTNYPNKKTSSNAVVRRQSRKRFLIGVLFAFVSGYVLAWFYQPSVLTAWAQSYMGGSKASQRFTNAPAKTAELPKPKFEFYTLLTQEEQPLKAKPAPIVVPVPAPVATAPIRMPPPVKTAEVAVPLATTASKYTYLLQLASFQRREDAEQMKATLIMRGFDATIKTATQQGGVWHRVVIGPFTARLAAEKIQADIVRSEHISGIIRRMDT